jgi:ADP-ribosylglycohydrolase
VDQHSKILRKFEGCLLGGAMGDALGNNVEFQNLDAILKQYGSKGPRRLPGSGHITDDTQMTLFSAEGMIWAPLLGIDQRTAVWEAYQRWLVTQSFQPEASQDGYGLAREAWLYARRAPGGTCLSALGSGQTIMGSKGCGGVMRAAPFGLQPQKSARRCFHDAVDAAALTHGHPSGYLPAGALAAVIRCMLDPGMTLEKACYQALRILRDWKGSEDTQRMIRIAMGLSLSVKKGTSAHQQQRWISVIGGGWVGDECLGIGLFAVFAALRSGGSFLDAISLAVTHSGDSDSTGAVAGNIAGVLGTHVLPPGWDGKLENGKAAPVIRDLAAQLLDLSERTE